jgi:AAA+ ATPase superfamily predicted ATPase
MSSLKTGVLAEPVLVGREKELEELQHYLDKAIERKGNTVFISGEAGAGKTRLLTYFLNRAKKRGITGLSGWCLSNAAVPYFPFFEAFRRFFAEEQSSEDKVAVSAAGGVQQSQFEQTRIGLDESDVAAWMMGPALANLSVCLLRFGKIRLLLP